MSQFGNDESRLAIKLVYYGPALSGKTTNLIYTKARNCLIKGNMAYFTLQRSFR